MRSMRVFISLLTILLASGTFAHAQEEIVLTVSFIRGMEYLEDAQFFEAFEQAHNVRVNVIYPEFLDLRITPPNLSLEDHLQAQDTYTQSADIVLVSVGESLPTEVTLESTRAGYYLDLNPLLQIADDFDASVYYPAVWESASWDGGTWLLPLTSQIYSVIYEPEAFDSAGLAYPTSEWALADWVNAIETLTPRDSNGNALRPGYIGFNRSDSALIYALLDAGVMDTTTFPPIPQFTRPDLITFAEAWAPLYQTGAVYSPNYTYVEDFMPSATPLTTDRIQSIDFSSTQSAALFPGERAGVSISGIAISSRTEHPELAYQLAQYLANDSRVTDAVQTTFSFIRRARPVYDDVIAIDTAPSIISDLTAEEEALINESLQNAIPASDLHFFDAFKYALQQETDVGVALQNAEALARQTLEQISGTATTASIATPVPSAVLNAGEIALKFHIGGSTQEGLDEFVQQFVENDPQVGELILDHRTLPLERLTQEVDCLYLPDNRLSIFPQDSIINLDPLLSADPTFETDNFLTGILDQVRGDNQIMGYPLTIDPLVIQVSDEIQLPPNWTVNDLMTLGDDSSVLASTQPGITLLMLITANGGLPIDFRSSPPQLDFVGSITPIREVLDLARAGRIFYPPLSTWENDPPPVQPPIYVNTLSRANTTDYHLMLFPEGTDYTPVSYNLGTAYITSQTTNPEACYRLITALAQRPDLLNGLPTQRFSSQNGELYQSLETILASTNVVVFPYRETIMPYWLYRAFDRYVLEDADLETALMEAEGFTQEYLTCALAFQLNDYRQQVTCAMQIDPTSADYFTLGGAIGD